jgi:hypothetical protein
MNQLTIGGIVTNAIQLGMKNFASVIGAVLLWLITIWIPYINVGTTIALIGLVVAISKGNIISPTEIFNARYRRNIGEFFLLVAFVYIGTAAGFFFVIIPGIVISIAWSQALYLLIDKNMNPTEAITSSNKITYGKKWTIFLGQFILTVIMLIAIFIIYTIFSFISEGLAVIIALICYLIFIVIMLGAAAYIYGQLSKGMDKTEALE